MTALRIEKLQRGHHLDTFDCGREALNRFLIRYAFPNQQAGASQTYIALADEEVAGYYTLVVGQVEYSDGPERLPASGRSRFMRRTTRPSLSMSGSTLSRRQATLTICSAYLRIFAPP